MMPAGMEMEGSLSSPAMKRVWRSTFRGRQVQQPPRLRQHHHTRPDSVSLLGQTRGYVPPHYPSLALPPPRTFGNVPAFVIR